MKSLLFSTLLISALLFGCTKDSSSTITGVAGTMSASSYGFDGSNSGKFTSSAAGIVKATATGTPITTISAIRDGGKESINIVLFKDVTVIGVIKLGPGYTNGGISITKDYTSASDRSIIYTTNNSTTANQGGGEVNITKVDGKNIEGTFYFIAYNSAGNLAFAEQGTFKGTSN